VADAAGRTDYLPSLTSTVFFTPARPCATSAALRLRVRPVGHGRGSGRVRPGPKNTKGWGQSTQKMQGKRHHFQTQKRGPSRPRPPTPIQPSGRPSPGAHFCRSTRRPAAAPSPTNTAAKMGGQRRERDAGLSLGRAFYPCSRLYLPSDEVSKAIANKKSGRGCRRERRDSRTSTAKIAPPPPHQRPQRAAPPPLLPIGGSVPTTPTPDPSLQTVGKAADHHEVHAGMWSKWTSFGCVDRFFWVGLF